VTGLRAVARSERAGEHRPHVANVVAALVDRVRLDDVDAGDHGDLGREAAVRGDRDVSAGDRDPHARVIVRDVTGDRDRLGVGEGAAGRARDLEDGRLVRLVRRTSDDREKKRCGNGPHHGRSLQQPICPPD